ncbi:MAG TPA: cytochrome P450 [Acidimicrobiales bacterium]|nr:cytochrome P450 [Acidimicrobiales bacterium]
MSRAEAVSLTTLLAEPGARADPYPVYARLRAMGRLVPNDLGGFLLTRYADVAAVLRDSRFSGNPRHQDNFEVIEQLAEAVGLSALLELTGRLLLMADPPDHTRLRRIAGKAFSVRTVEGMRARIGVLVDSLLDAVEADGGTDLVDALAFPLPADVISDMLGVPPEDHEQLRLWTRDAIKALDPVDDPMTLFPAAEALDAMRAYFDDLVTSRRADPGDDLLSALIAAQDEGDRLSHDELLDTAILLFGAGHETTVNLISGGTLTLLRHPDQLERLRADPSLIGGAVEELLRFVPPVQLTSRIATVDAEVAGHPIAKGTELLTLIAGANRDPDEFAGPDRFDIGRRDNHHLSFSAGIHFCLGAPLARMEGQEAIGRLVARFPRLSLATDDVEWKSTNTMRGPQQLDLVW